MSLFQELKTPSSVRSQTVPVNTPLMTSDINSELDELDREEFFRLKKVQGKKQRDTAAQDEEMRIRREAKEAAAAGKGKDKDSDKENEGGGDILGESEDADVIF